MRKIISAMLAGAMLIGTAPVLAAEEPIINNDFESGEAGFAARGTAEASISYDTAHSGSASLLVSGRGGNAWEGVNTSVVNDIKLDETYYGQMYVKAAVEGESFTVKMSIDFEDETGNQYPQIGQAKVSSSEWTLIEGTWKAEYQGNLKALNIDLETDDSGIGKSFYVDDIYFAHESAGKPAVIVTPTEDPNANMTLSGIKLPPDAAETAQAESIEKLMALGVVNGYPDGSFKPENKVTRAEFLTMLLRLLRIDMPRAGASGYTDVPDDHFASGAIAWATGSGVCDGYGDGMFGPEDTVTYPQAIKMLMSTLGYATVAENNGGYPNGYMAAAASEGVAAKGADSSGELTRALTAELLVSALDVNLYTLDGSGDITKDRNKTLLTEYYDGDEDKGYVQSSNDISTNGSKTGLGIVNIDGIDYYAGSTKAEELVGYYVDYIYETIDDERYLLFVKLQSSKNTELEIDARDIEGYSNYEYEYEYEPGKTKKKKLDKDFTLVYNGQTMTTGYEDSLMVPEIGTIKLVGNDTNNYSMVYITAYETLIVSSVNRTTSEVYDINNKKRKLDDAEGDIVFIKPDGTEGELSDIRKDDVLQIAATTDNDKTKVVILRSTVEGSVDIMGDEDMTIDGTKYELSPAYQNRNYERPKIGSTVTAYFDINGEVVYLDDGSDTSMSVGYLLGAAVLESGDELQLRYFTSDGDVTTNIITGGNVKIDGKTYSTNNMETMLKVILGTNTDTVKRRIFRYSVNSGGQINKLDFARSQEACLTQAEKDEGEQTLYIVNNTYYANDGKQSATSTTSVKYKYKHNARTFIDESGIYSSIALDPEAIVFKIPEEGSDKETDYDEYEITTVSNLGYDEEYKLYAYKSGTSGLMVDYVVLFANNSGGENINSENGYVVTKITDTLSRTNDEVHAIEVYQDGAKKSYTVKDSDVWDDAVAENDGKEIEKGDVVRFDTDSYGQISNLTVDKGKNKYGDWFYSARGYLYLKDDGYAYFTTKRPSANMSFDDMILIPIDDFDVTVYNKRTEEVYKGVPDEVIDYTTDPENYSSVYITMRNETAMTLICVTEG